MDPSNTSLLKKIKMYGIVVTDASKAEILVNRTRLDSSKGIEEETPALMMFRPANMTAKGNENEAWYQ